MRKLSLAKALSEFLAISTIAISIAQGGTIIGGNISFHGVSSATSSQVQPGSITIQSENIPSFSSVNWHLYQSYQDQNVCMKLYGSTWNPQPQYVTIPKGANEVSITVEPYNLNTGIVATFPGNVLGGQTLTLYVAPLFQGMYSYGVDRMTPYLSPAYYMNCGWWLYCNNGFIYPSRRAENSPYYYIHSNSLPCIDTFKDYSLTSFNIQNVTVELSNGTVLIGPNLNGIGYYVSNLASSSVMFVDNLSFYSMLTTPEYVRNESLYYNIDYLPPFYKASCVAYDPTQHGCLAQTPNGFPEVIITWQ